jgi:hypothetical protein
MRKLNKFNLIKFHYDDNISEDEFGGLCYMHGRNNKIKKVELSL